jgi:hypothetical protein
MPGRGYSSTLIIEMTRRALAWWLAQIAEAEPDAGGFRTIRLADVPTPEGREAPVLRIHPKTLIVVDVNPEGEYNARGAMPEVFEESPGDRECGRTVSEVDGRFVLTREMNEVLAEYERAGLHLVVVGLGEGAGQVSAFTGPRQHFIRIASGRREDITETLSKVAERMSRGDLPPGDVTGELDIGPR